MIRSLRAQLVVGLIGGVAVLASIAGLTVYTVVRRSVMEAFDDDLRLHARSLTGLVEKQKDTVVFEWEHYDPASGMTADAADGVGYMFQIWLPDGRELINAKVFGDFELPAATGEPGVETWRFIELPDGTTARAVSLRHPVMIVDDVIQKAPVGEFGLTVARRTTGIEALLTRVGLTFLGVGAVGVAAGCVGIAWYVRRTLRYLDPVVDQLEGLGGGDLSRRVAPGKLQSELIPLIEVINRLVAGLEVKVARERRFVSDAAHEFRNPIAAVRANLETYLMGDGSAPERVPDKRLLRSSLDAASQLQVVCERLLMLAGLESGRDALEPHEIDLAEYAESMLAEFEKAASERGLRFEWGERESVSVDTDAVLLNVILSNVLGNATSYASPAEPIRVSVASHPGGAVLTVVNAVPPGKEIDPTKVAEPFWRADRARLVGGGHVGLGLTIVRSAVERLGGSVTCSLDSAGRFGVELRLPRAWTERPAHKAA